ncbi:(d)CMP kinase, partial [Escherichia coli]|uniref:(d)CMP kinase n=2 Tax=Pseudomonadota TaxID=1224 RepID=UPI001329C9F4
EKGLPATMESLLQDLRDRDARDAARSVAPLLKLPDAVLLDTTSKGVEEAVAFVVDFVRNPAAEAAG